jgi:hypothetical protein
MRRRQALLIELRERVHRIQVEIEAEQEKIEEIEYNIQRKQEDLEFHRTLIHELEVQDSATEIVTESEEITDVKVETRLADSARSPTKLTRAEYQEQKERARIWNLNREREAQLKAQLNRRR